MWSVNNGTGLQILAPQDLVKSESDDKQLAFNAPGKKINISKFTILFDGDIKCSSTACDRQNVACPGCFGKSKTSRPIVAQCDIAVQDCHKHENPHFQAFRSLTFTKLFFEDLWDCSTKDKNLFPPSRNQIRARVRQMVQFINDNDGWTVCGWHRNGKTTKIGDEKNREECMVQSSRTKGHITDNLALLA